MKQCMFSIKNPKQLIYTQFQFKKFKIQSLIFMLNTGESMPFFLTGKASFATQVRAESANCPYWIPSTTRNHSLIQLPGNSIHCRHCLPERRGNAFYSTSSLWHLILQDNSISSSRSKKFNISSTNRSQCCNTLP